MKDVIFVDHSILSTFGVCKEKARLSYVEHIRPITTGPPLVFGSAFHAAVAAYYTAISNQKQQRPAGRDPRGQAHAAFLDEVRKAGPDALPLSADSEEKRSVERGLNLIDAYIEKWEPSDINWDDVLHADTGEPYIEIGFAVHFMDWHGTPVVFAGKIDRIRRNRVDGQLYNWETKTTGSNVSYYVQQVRPNHQITGYKWACSELLKMNISGTILDVVYVSDRKVGGKFPNGIDIDKDFARVETRRSATDVEEFLYDLKLGTIDFLELQDRGLRRWRREAPTACYMYGGCHYRDACNSNLNPAIMAAKYKVERWAPWEMNVPVVTPSTVST